MARARNIKPAFFNNDILAELDPLDRLAFIGLWTIADYKGCLEYRPLKIKAMILPYDNCDFSKIAINLDKSGFIRLYSVDDVEYIKILNFEKHQNPHKNEKEKGSDIPDYQPQDIDSKGKKEKSRKIAINPDKNGTNRADSLNLIPDSLSLKPELVIPNGINLNAWNEWIDFRKAKKKPVSQLAATKQFELLLKYNEQEQQAIINNSITNDYQGLFEPKVTHENTTRNEPYQDNSAAGKVRAAVARSRAEREQAEN